MATAPESPTSSTDPHRTLKIGALIAVNVLLAGGLTGVAIAGLTGSGTPGAAPRATAGVDPTTPDPTRTSFPADTPAAVAGAAPCTPVRVLSSFENAEMLDRLIEAYAASPRSVEGACVTVTATKSKSGTAAADVAAGFPNLAPGAKPTLWIPDSSIWVDVARTAGADVTTHDTAGSSNIVLAMPEPLADASGWTDTPPSWAEVFAAAESDDFWGDLGHREWGGFKLGKTSPLVASSGAAAIYASFADAAGHVGDLAPSDVSSAPVIAAVTSHELATSHYMATPEHFLWHARQAEESGSSADFLSAVIVDEKSIWDYNRGITSRDGITRVAADPPVEPLVPVYPSDGFYAADDAIVPLAGNATPAEIAATDDFVRFIGTVEGQAAVQAGGYRDRNGDLADAVATVGALAPTATADLAWPSADVVQAVNAAFPEVRKRANVLFLIDVSGSMDEPIGGGQTKLTAAKQAITLALDHFTAGDHVGLAAFAQDDAGTLVPGAVTPMSDIATERDQLVAGIGSLRSMGDTPLFEAVTTFTGVVASNWDPDRINAVVVLSDGENDTNTPTTTQADMLAALEHAHHGGTPVMVFTLAYGQDADAATLQSISSATGAHYYDATDPTKLAEVLGDLVTSF